MLRMTPTEGKAEGKAGVKGRRALAQAHTFAELLVTAMGETPQWQVAEQIGVSQSRISRWLSGGVPDAEKTALVARWLRVSEGDLFTFIRAHHSRPQARKSADQRFHELESAMQHLTDEVARLTAALAQQGVILPGPAPEGHPNHLT